MRTILYILTRPEDELTRELMAHQRALPSTHVDVADVSSGAPAVYDILVEKIFAADSIHVS